MPFAKEDLRKLGVIQALVARHFVYTSDTKKFKLREYWEGDQIGVATLRGKLELRGDCEEYAMTCMRKIIEAGYNVRLVICQTETGEGHCICEAVSVDKRDAVYFDNRRHQIVRRDNLKGYIFVACSPWSPQPADRRPWSLVKKS